MTFNFPFLETYGAAIAAVFGGVGVKVLEKIMSKRSEQFSEAAQIREELRTEVERKGEELELYRKEAADWREKYYQQVEENIMTSQILEALRLEHQKLQHKDHPDTPTP